MQRLRLVLVVCGILLMGGGVVAAPPSLAAVTIVVDGDDTVSDLDGCGGGAGDAADACNSIQAGVDASAPADRVEVRLASSPYAEAVEIDKAGLELVGPLEGVPGEERDPVPAPAFEAIIDPPDGSPAAVRVAAEGVIIDGLVVRGATGSGGDAAPGILVEADAAWLRSLIVRGNSPGISLGGAGHLVELNAFYENDLIAAGKFGIDAVNGVSESDIVDNFFGDLGHAALRAGAGTGNLIAGNVMLSPDDDDATGLTLGALSDSIVVDNVVIGADSVGISLSASDGVLLAGNLVADSWFGAISLAPGSGLWTGPNRDVTIAGNALVDNIAPNPCCRAAIMVEPDALVGELDVVANRIVGNDASGAYGIYNDDGLFSGSADPVRAERNWWGCNGGPGADGCDLVSSAVDADPWLTLSHRADPATLTAPGSARLVADLLRDSNGNSSPEAELVPAAEVRFAKLSGPGSLDSPFAPLSSGIASSAVRSDTSGTATVEARLDEATAVATVQFSVPERPAVRDTTAPTLQRVSVFPARFTVNRFGRPQVPLAALLRRGTKLRYTLSEPARVTVTVAAILRGRRVRGRCRVRPHGLIGRRCTRFKRVGSFARESAAGPTAMRFSGRIGRQALRPGRYRATLVATDAAGNRSAKRGVYFTVVSRARR